MRLYHGSSRRRAGSLRRNHGFYPRHLRRTGRINPALHRQRVFYNSFPVSIQKSMADPAVAVHGEPRSGNPARHRPVLHPDQMDAGQPAHPDSRVFLRTRAGVGRDSASARQTMERRPDRRPDRRYRRRMADRRTAAAAKSAGFTILPDPVRSRRNLRDDPARHLRQLHPAADGQIRLRAECGARVEKRHEHRRATSARCCSSCSAFSSESPDSSGC